MRPPVTYRFLPPDLADRLGRMSLAVRHPVDGPMQGLHRSRNLGASVEFAEYRSYVHGDPVQHIDWPVYARSDRFVIRRFQEETNVRGFVLLDVSESMSFTSGSRMNKFEYSASLAAALLYILVHQGDVAGLITFDGGVRDFFDPAGTFEGLRPMLKHMETVKPSRRSNMEQAFTEAANLMTGKCFITILSDLLEPTENILRAIRMLQHDRHDLTVFHVLDPSEMSLEMTGLTEIREMETDTRLLVDTDEIKQAYRNEVESFIREIQAGCSESRIEYHCVDTRTPVEDSILKRATVQ